MTATFFLNNTSLMDRGWWMRVVITGLLGKWPAKDMTVHYCSQLAGKSGNSGVSTTTKISCSNVLGWNTWPPLALRPATKSAWYLGWFAQTCFCHCPLPAARAMFQNKNEEKKMPQITYVLKTFPIILRTNMPMESSLANRALVRSYIFVSHSWWDVFG